MIPLRLIEALHAQALRFRIEDGRVAAEERDLERERRRGGGGVTGLVMHSANWWIATAAVAAIGDARAGPAAEARARARSRQGGTKSKWSSPLVSRREGDGGGVEWRPREDRQTGEERRGEGGPSLLTRFPAPTGGPPQQWQRRGPTFSFTFLQGKNFYDGLP
nr:unnamed protein product [Digitaria exilis]